MRNLIFLGIVIILSSCQTTKRNTSISGPVFGTSYNFVFEANPNLSLEKGIDSLFYVINKSMSTYMVNSDISKINRNESQYIDEHFINVFRISSQIYRETKGVFDPTIGAIVNAWRFGPESSDLKVTSSVIDSLMVSVGFDKLSVEDHKIIKAFPQTFIDFNSVAKGYAVDVIANYFDTMGVANYLLEIGGELKSKGINVEKDKPWQVGIENPNFDGTQSVVKAIALNEAAMATSGTYRKFKIDEDGNRYAHIIDTKTGYPSKSNILSVSVITKDCVEADAYATAFQAMGMTALRAFLKVYKHIQVYAIYEADDQTLQSESFNGFPQ